MRRFSQGDAIYSQGDAADSVYNLDSGWIGLHQDMVDGRRHISKFLLPGALFGVEPKNVPHGQSATALTAVTLRAIPVSHFNHLRHDPCFNERLLLMLTCENYMATEALTAMSRGTAIERVARLLCELTTRLTEPGTDSNSIAIKVPLTQRVIADATGLTSIHVNRVIGRLRAKHLVELRDGVMVVDDLKRLTVFAGVSTSLRKVWRIGIAFSPPLRFRRQPPADNSLAGACSAAAGWSHFSNN